MPLLLTEAAKSLAAYLSQVLPAISDNWWKDTVLKALTFDQRQRVERKGSDSLLALDLAALIRILDQNWYTGVCT